MNVNDRNTLLSLGKFDNDSLWPKIKEYESQALTFRFNFGLNEFPKEPGVILVRGPRQYGKSTWLEQALLDTVEEFHKGSGYFLNGDDMLDADELERGISGILPMFNPKSRVKRLFIDEVTSVNHWEKAIKRLADRGQLKDVLVVTTGSKAMDLRRGSERLPGRKGKLDRTEYVFTGVAYKDFHEQTHKELGDQTWIAYLLSGGSPIAAKEIWQMERIPDYFYEITRDWILGELLKSGRARPFALAVIRTVLRKGGSRLGYLNLAKDSGLANNTIAADYIEQFSDLLSIIPSHQWDADRDVPLQRKPCKFHFVNLGVAFSFSEHRMNSIHEFTRQPQQEKAKWLEWLVAQELFRRQCIENVLSPESIHYWHSSEHEIDFLDTDRRFYEVKAGKCSPIEFTWFAKAFPNKKLLVISESQFEARNIKGITFEQFLLADGFPHPYPGMVDDPDVYNDYARF